MKGLKIGIASGFNAGADEQVRKAIDEAIQIYKKHGFTIQETIHHFYQNGEDAYSMSKGL